MIKIKSIHFHNSVLHRAKNWFKNEYTLRQFKQISCENEGADYNDCFFRKNLISMFSKSTYYWHTKAMACSWKIRSVAIGGWLIVPITASKSCHHIFWIPNRRFFGRLDLVFSLVTRLSEVYYPLHTMLRQGEIYEKYVNFKQLLTRFYYFWSYCLHSI